MEQDVLAGKGMTRRGQYKGCAQILVVDDDPDVREAAEELLSDAGYQVATATDGAEALGKLKGGPRLPSLIILDLDMPVMSGRDLLSKMAVDRRLGKIPVLILSAALDREYPGETPHALRKPISGQRFLDEVGAFLAQTDRPVSAAVTATDLKCNAGS